MKDIMPILACWNPKQRDKSIAQILEIKMRIKMAINLNLSK